jgi:hypothetical protein
MSTKIAKITFTDYSGLQTGRISTIHGAYGTTLQFKRQKDQGSVFIMGNRKGEHHTLALEVTDEVRLNAHFKGFQENAGRK